MSRRVYNLNNPTDVEDMVDFLITDDDNDPTVNEDFGEESYITSEDEVEERDDDSETQQEGATDEADDAAADASYFLGKDKITKWYRNPPPRSVRRGTHNLITHLPRVRGNARDAKTAVDCSNCLFTEKC